MAYKPVIDLTVDVAIENSFEDVSKFLLSVFSRKLVLMKFDLVDEAVEVVVRGTKTQLLDWLKGYYCESEFCNGPAEDPEGAEKVWTMFADQLMTVA